MHLNRREGGLLTFIVLAWALSPLVLHSLLPRHEEHTGTVMVVGLLVGGIAVVALLMRVARRLDRECRDRLARLGFRVVDLGTDLLPDWIPAEHRDRPRLEFDGFQSQGNPHLRSGYERNRDGFRTSLFGYSFGRDATTRGLLIVMRIESPLWNWPEFSCAVGSRWSGIHQIEGWERIQLEEDPAFSKASWLQAPRPDWVRTLFTPELRCLVLDHPKFRVHASGRVLMLYSDAFRLIPGEAEAFVEQAGQLATRWTHGLERVRPSTQ